FSDSIFSLRRVEALFRPLHRDHIQRAAVRRGARALSFLRSIVRSGKLFRNCIRMERLDSRAHDNAFVVQFAYPYCSCVSRGFLTMSARGSDSGGIRLDQLGEDRLLRDILHGISTKAAARGAAGDDCAVVKSR